MDIDNESAIEQTYVKDTAEIKWEMAFSQNLIMVVPAQYIKSNNGH